MLGAFSRKTRSPLGELAIARNAATMTRHRGFEIESLRDMRSYTTNKKRERMAVPVGEQIRMHCAPVSYAADEPVSFVINRALLDS